MRTWISCLLVVSLWSASMPAGALAKGGGHGGGGHASGGHASGSHASGGHASSRGHASAATHSGHAASRADAPATSAANSVSGRHSRNGQPFVGTAVPRSSTPGPSTVTPAVIVPTGIWPHYGGLLGAGAFYDPFFWNSPSPWYGAGVRLPAAGTDSSATTLDPFGTDGPSGGLRLKVEPKTAEVFVDGFYAGVVDDFNGVFQHLTLTVGPHHVDVRAMGFEPLGFDVDILTHYTTVYRGVLPRLAP